MGKKAKRGAGADQRDDWGDGASCSSQTTYTTCQAEFDEQDDSVDHYSEALDQLLEKRGSTREQALSKLLQMLREEVRAEDAQHNMSTVIGRCINGMRRGGPAEAALSAQLLALHLITLPEQSENNLLEAQPELQRAAASGASSEVRVCATEALAMACFVSAEDDVLRLEVMERLRALWGVGSGALKGHGTSGEGGDARAVTAALRGWGLVLTALLSPLPSATLEVAVRQLAALLHAGNVEVRAAAGEALALVYSQGGSGTRGFLQSLTEQEDEEEEQEGVSEDDEGAREHQHDGELLACAAPPTPDPALLSRMRQLAVAHPSSDALRRSKRDRAAQRAAFRAILASVERGGQVAATKLKLQHGATLVVDTVEGGVRLAAFRRALAGGLQVHMQSNPLLHAVFNFTPASGPRPRLSALEKRATRSSNSADAKWRTADRKGGRAQKSMMMDGGGDY